MGRSAHADSQAAGILSSGSGKHNVTERNHETIYARCLRLLCIVGIEDTAVPDHGLRPSNEHPTLIKSAIAQVNGI
jgi:type II secretory pathway component PulL